jgi:hypothetical protein
VMLGVAGLQQLEPPAVPHARTENHPRP